MVTIVLSLNRDSQSPAITESSVHDAATRVGPITYMGAVVCVTLGDERGGRALVSEKSHVACVERWFNRVAKGLPIGAFIDAAEAAFEAIFHRALQALGEITLIAIAERVVVHAADETPVLALLRIEPKGLDTRDLRDRANQVDRDHLTRGLCALLVEFLAVLERLTAGVLTEPLHEEMASLGLDHSTEIIRGKSLRLKARKKT
jgi:hypothetical protein